MAHLSRDGGWGVEAEEHFLYDVFNCMYIYIYVYMYDYVWIYTLPKNKHRPCQIRVWKISFHQKRTIFIYFQGLCQLTSGYILYNNDASDSAPPLMGLDGIILVVQHVKEEIPCGKVT